MIRRPMKAYAETPPLESIQLPVLASRKLDGIRAVINDSQVLSNTLKPIPNAHIQNVLGLPQLQGLDGELIVGLPHGAGVFNRTSSGVMSIGNRPDFMYLVFDCWDLPGIGFQERYNAAITRVKAVQSVSSIPVYYVPHVLVNTLDELVALEDQYLAEGYEGMMVRSLTGLYKEGRSTLKEHTLFKIKRFVDAEAIVIGVEQEYENTNVAKLSETGYAKRSSSQAGMVPKDSLGAINVRDIETGREFSIGSGFTAAQRKELWRTNIIGKIVTYKHFPYGDVNKPRLPVFKGFRDEMDM